MPKSRLQAFTKHKTLNYLQYGQSINDPDIKNIKYLYCLIIGKLVPQLENAVVHASIFTILVITIERHNAICFPLKKTYHAFTSKRTSKCIASIWICAYISTCPFMIMTHQRDTEFYDGTPCKICKTSIDDVWEHVYYVSVFVVFYLCTFIILLCMYIRIIRCLVNETISMVCQGDTRSMSALRSRKQVVRMLIGIMILFFVTVFPMRIVSLWMVYAPRTSIEQLGVDGYINLLSAARIMVYINSAGNPIIYSLTSTKFKSAFSKLLCKSFKNIEHLRSYEAPYKRTAIVQKPTTKYTKYYLGSEGGDERMR
ncbi:hypothetical protein KUTeg_004963, partial [Tegillarca granosa]